MVQYIKHSNRAFTRTTFLKLLFPEYQSIIDVAMISHCNLYEHTCDRICSYVHVLLLYCQTSPTIAT